MEPLWRDDGPRDLAGPANAGRRPSTVRARDLAGRKVLVFGASSGIGRATALAAAARGCRLALAARNSSALAHLAHLAGPPAAPVPSGDAAPLPCDVADPEACGALVQSAAAFCGGLDAVVYAAGTSPLGPVEKTAAGTWSHVLAVNTVGAALVIAAALPHLRRAPCGQGTVLVLSSHSVIHPWPGLTPYAASKAALSALVRGLRAEEPDVRFVDVTVGPTATAFADAWDPDHAREAFARWEEGGYLRHRVLHPDEMAVAVLDALADDSGPDDVAVIGEDPAQDPPD